MPERRLFDPDTAPAWVPAKKWVTMAGGGDVCVWELSVPEQFAVAEAAQRHPDDPRPGGNDREAAIWLLAYACRKGEEPGAARFWDDLHAHQLFALAPIDFGALLNAARALTGNGREAEERARGFTPVEKGGGTPSLPTGVSSTCGASPENWTGSESPSSGERSRPGR